MPRRRVPRTTEHSSPTLLFKVSPVKFIVITEKGQFQELSLIKFLVVGITCGIELNCACANLKNFFQPKVSKLQKNLISLLFKHRIILFHNKIEVIFLKKLHTVYS